MTPSARRRRLSIETAAIRSGEPHRCQFAISLSARGWTNRRSLAFRPTAGGEADLCRFGQTDRGWQTPSDCEQARTEYRKLVGAAFESSYAPNIDPRDTLPLGGSLVQPLVRSRAIWHRSPGTVRSSRETSPLSNLGCRMGTMAELSDSRSIIGTCLDTLEDVVFMAG
jgi:hypothetical protein